MIEIISFIFIKMLALMGLLFVFLVPLYIARLVVFWPTDSVDGFQLLANNKFARYNYWFLSGSFVFMAYVLYAAWAWPFGVPRTYSSDDHLTGAWYNVLTENMQEHLQRKKSYVRPVQTELGFEIRRFELISWNPPKHFYVTLKDVKTGQRYEGIYVSKHCNAVSSLKHGEQYNLKVSYFNNSNEPGMKRMRFENLSSAFC